MNNCINVDSNENLVCLLTVAHGNLHHVRSGVPNLAHMYL